MVRVPVLCFHGVGDKKSDINVSNKYFEKLMKFFHFFGYKSITISQFLECVDKKEFSKLKKTFVITFDDAFLSVRKNAYPIMKKYGFFGNLFIATQFIGKESSLYAKTKAYPSYKLLDDKDILFLKSKQFEIHSHTHAHNPWDLNEQDLEKDLLKSISIIKKKYINYDLKYLSFCYPKNKVSNNLRKLCKKYFYAGFAGGGKSYYTGDLVVAINRVEPKENQFFLLLLYKLFIRK